MAAIDVSWLVYIRSYCVPIATSNQNERSRLRYLGEAQIGCGSLPFIGGAF